MEAAQGTISKVAEEETAHKVLDVRRESSGQITEAVKDIAFGSVRTPTSLRYEVTYEDG